MWDTTECPVTCMAMVINYLPHRLYAEGTGSIPHFHFLPTVGNSGRPEINNCQLFSSFSPFSAYHTSDRVFMTIIIFHSGELPRLFQGIL